MSEHKILYAISSIFILLLFFTVNSTAQNNNGCASSSCGNIRISYPYRLSTSPKSCGYDDPSFELECENNETTIFTARSTRYVVRDIDYDYYSIRLADPNFNSANLSSCPVYSTDYLYGEFPDILGVTLLFNWNGPVYFIYCLNSTSKYVEAPFCLNSTSNSSREIYSYVVMARDTSMVPPGLEESCTVDRVVWTSGRRGDRDNSSLAAIYDELAYGVELTWYRTLCGECERTRGTCSLQGDRLDRITCKHYCMEDTPYSERTFRCKVEYWGILGYAVVYGGIALGALAALRFLIGFSFLVALMVSQWRKRQLPV